MRLEHRLAREAQLPLDDELPPPTRTTASRAPPGPNGATTRSPAHAAGPRSASRGSASTRPLAGSTNRVMCGGLSPRRHVPRRGYSTENVQASAEAVSAAAAKPTTTWRPGCSGCAGFAVSETFPSWSTAPVSFSGVPSSQRPA